MADNSSQIQEYSNTRHGGARQGAGRKQNGADARWYAARGINPLMAAEILATVCDERRTWKRILESTDDRIVLQAMCFLVSMRDGKPAQQINVSSTSLNVTASSIEQARAIVAEIRGEPSLPSTLSSAPRLGEGECIDGNEVDSKVNSEDSTKALCFEPPKGQ